MAQVQLAAFRGSIPMRRQAAIESLETLIDEALRSRDDRFVGGLYRVLRLVEELGDAVPTSALSDGGWMPAQSVHERQASFFSTTQSLSPLPARQKIASLSHREREILECLVRGETDKEIGLLLNIAAGSVHNHIKAILQKLGVKNRTQAAVYAVRHGADAFNVAT